MANDNQISAKLWEKIETHVKEKTFCNIVEELEPLSTKQKDEITLRINEMMSKGDNHD